MGIRDTVPRFKGHIAVLRIDLPFVDPIQDALYFLYPQMPVGGIVIFENVLRSPEVMDVWTGFKRDYNMSEELVPVDRKGAWFRKERQFAVNLTLMRAPRDTHLQEF